MDDFKEQEVVKTGEWVLTMFITVIPLVGFIMLFVWGFGSGNNQNKANWAKAVLIWQAVIIVISVLFALLFGAAIFSGLSSY
jgi:hypothetical protein